MAADAALNNGLSVARLRALLNLLNLLYLLYLLKRGAATPPRALPCRFRHVADVPGVQGQLEVWKFGGLEAWLSCTPLRPSRACRAFRSPWPWKVWPSGPARSVLRSPGRQRRPLVLCAPSCQPRRANLPHTPIASPVSHRGVSNQLICQSAGWRSHPLCLRGYRQRTGSTAVSRSWWVLGSKTKPMR